MSCPVFLGNRSTSCLSIMTMELRLFSSSSAVDLWVVHTARVYGPCDVSTGREHG